MVERYSMIERDFGAKMDVSSNGAWVRYCDLAAARAEIVRLREAIRQADDILEDCGFAIEIGARRVLRIALSSTGEKV